MSTTKYGFDGGTAQKKQQLRTYNINTVILNNTNIKLDQAAVITDGY